MSSHPAVRVASQLSERGQALYIGKTHDGKPEFAGREDHLLVLGPPRKGKTSGLIAPSIAVHPGPTVIVSTRHDIVPVVRASRMALAEAHGGEVVELALGEASSLLPVASWSATDGCNIWETALDRARVIVTTDNPNPTDKFWSSSAINLLSSCLFAAALIGDDDRELARRIKSADISEYYDWLVHKVGNDHPAVHTLWRFINPDAMAAETLQGIFVTTTSGPLQSFEYEPIPSKVTFSINEFVRSWGTVFITIPWYRHEAFQPRVTAFLEAVIASWRKYANSSVTLLLVLDEVANVAPIPTLPQMITAGGGDGIQLILGMQEPSQVLRWGQQANVILNSVSHLAVFEGLMADGYLSSLVNLKGTEVRNDREVHVLPETPGGPWFASHARLVEERKTLETVRDLHLGAARIRSALLRTAAKLTKARQQDKIRCRIESGAGLTKRVLLEIERFTAVREVPKRLPRLDIDEIVQGKPAHFFLWSQGFTGFKSYQPWYKDPFWLSVLGKEGLRS